MKNKIQKPRAVFFLIFSFFYFSCSNDYHPETHKRGYFRIDLPEKKYQEFDQPGYPYTFEYPVYASIVKDTTFFDVRADPWWINIDFPRFGGRIYISYKEIGKNKLDSLVKDAFEMAYKQHTYKASSIEPMEIHTPNNVSGIYVTLTGNTATANQFWLTDSTKHFLRGALYFNATPNEDSLSIVNTFLGKDLVHLISTLKWK